jgi:predicted dehydrogenase
MKANQIRVGLVGVHPEKGWAATAHIPALKQLPEYLIQAISHKREDVARSAAELFGISTYYDSNQDLVTDPNVDLVVITVKVPQHRQLILQAIEAGKAVFSEWPLGVNLAEANLLCDSAKAANVRTAIGLQTRAAPAFNYGRKLIKDGYVGRVLSATMIGSGIIWGDAMSDGFEYTLDPGNGASMLQVPFAHSIDGLLHLLDSKLNTVSATLSNSRESVRLLESGRSVPLTVPDQVQLASTLEGGPALTVHFRGGLSRGTNFHVEINGTEGDLILTSPVGYIGIGGTKLVGARAAETLHELDIPTEYNQYAEVGMPAQNIAIQYARLASDFVDGTRIAPDFDEAVGLHQLIRAIEQSGDGLRQVTVF